MTDFPTFVPIHFFMTHDILTAIPLGILLSFTIGPVFFVLLETSATKGFRAALMFNAGVIIADITFILIAYFSTTKILEKLKDDPALFIFGGVLLVVYGIVSFIKTQNEQKQIPDKQEINIPKNNYIKLFLKGFLLNFINIGVLGFWIGIIVIFVPQLEMKTNKVILFFSSIIIVYLLVDIIKIVLAKQLKNKLTANRIFQIKRWISVLIVLFGLLLISQGFFPKQKQKIRDKIEDIKNS